MPEEKALLAIGELARRTGTATSALRYYERIGLLPPAERARGRRHYPPATLERLAFVRLCQDAGFTLTEICELLVATGRRRRSWSGLAERKVDELDSRIAEAQRAKKLLKQALACPHRDLLACPHFRAAIHARQRERPSAREPEQGVYGPDGRRFAVQPPCGRALRDRTTHTMVQLERTSRSSVRHS